ncbi:MAG: metallophosphoesterase [Marinospirillum sp.]|uniref:metallophosphoesterase n=1 Tax=Marinospirillum sp. TaxID=2183934 RepID=UPI0019DC5289|nr:metallophosphoesterase [Marinospirillum sp.]MBE0505941.1 metallophosphoesterase [Marinospirillum sp.]
MAKRPVLRVVQMTDLHLLSDPAARFKGEDTRSRFLQALALTKRLAPDLLILTGDLAQDEAQDTYLWLYQQLQNSGIQWFWLPGNHDRPELMQLFAPPVFYHQTPHWQLLGLNTRLPGRPEGELSETELQRLQQALVCNKPLLLAMHHHPLQVKSRWMDAIALQNTDALWQLVDKNTVLKLLLCGHVHQPLSRWHQGVQVLASPATALQFTPLQNEFSINNKALPAIRLVRLLPGGVFSSRLLYFNPQHFTHREGGQACG